MTKLRLPGLALIVLCAAIVGLLVSWFNIQRGWLSPVLPEVSLITLVAMMLIIGGLGLWVFLSKRRIISRRVHPLRAARVVLLGQAGAYAGALLAGWHLGVLAFLLPAGAELAASTRFGLVYTAVGIAQILLGYLVEFFCKIDGGSDDDETENSADRVAGVNTSREGESGYARRGR